MNNETNKDVTMSSIEYQHIQKMLLEKEKHKQQMEIIQQKFKSYYYVVLAFALLMVVAIFFLPVLNQPFTAVGVVLLACGFTGAVLRHFSHLSLTHTFKKWESAVLFAGDALVITVIIGFVLAFIKSMIAW